MIMLNDNEMTFDELVDLSKTLSEKAKTDFAIYQKSIDKKMDEVSDEQKGQLERVKAMTKKAMNLAMSGKINESNKIINQLKNECKNNE